MDDDADVIAAIRRQLGDAAVRTRDDAAIDIEHADAWYVATITPSRITVALAPTDGFVLALRWVDAGPDASPRLVALDDTFLVETNDPALAAAWLDDASRTAVCSASRLHVAPPGRDRDVGPLARDTSWRFSIGDDHAIATRSEPEISAARVATIVATVVAIAAAQVRWTRAFARLAHELGGHAASLVEVGGQAALKLPRGQVVVAVRLARRLLRLRRSGGGCARSSPRIATSAAATRCR